MIQTRDLTRYYGSLAAVQDLSLAVESREIFGFVGPNGAGKTTTIRMIVGLLRPTSGTVSVAGHDLQREPLEAKRALGYLAQSPPLYEKLTGREFLRFLGGLNRLSDALSEERGGRLLELMELSGKADQLIESYSGGMRKRLGLCGALLHEPPVLVLDEPFTGLDPYGARRVKDLLRQLCNQGNTIFLSTHVLEVAERVCDRIGILDRGRLVAVGTMEDLGSQAQSTSETTLEDLFMQLTAGEGEAGMVSALD